MKLNELLILESALNQIADVTDTEVSEIIDALIGVAWDEENAGQIKRACYDPMV